MPNQLEIQIDQVSTFTSRASIGSHRVLIDRPSAKGGTDQGPMGGELFLAAVGGCFMSNLLAAIRARDAQLSNVKCQVIGMIIDSPARFESLQLCVIAEGGNQEAIQKLVEIADRGCIMMNTLRGKLEVRISVGVP